MGVLKKMRKVKSIYDKTDMQKVFSRNVKQIMDEKGIKQEALAAEIGISQGTLSADLSPSRKHGLPDITRIAAIADALGVSIDGLLGRKPPETDSGSGVPDATAFCSMIAALWDNGLIRIAPDSTERIDYDGINDPGYCSARTIKTYKITFPAAFDIQDYAAQYPGSGAINSALSVSWTNAAVNKLLGGLYSLQPMLEYEAFTDEMKRTYINGLLKDFDAENI